MLLIIGMVLSLIAVDRWYRHTLKKWRDMVDKPDNSLAGAMERSMRQ